VKRQAAIGERVKSLQATSAELSAAGVPWWMQLIHGTLTVGSVLLNNKQRVAAGAASRVIGVLSRAGDRSDTEVYANAVRAEIGASRVTSDEMRKFHHLARDRAI
jgi:hypothetical protein